MPAVWEAFRLGLEDESVVVVPSVLLLLLRQPRLRMIYVTSMPIKPSIVETNSRCWQE